MISANQRSFNDFKYVKQALIMNNSFDILPVIKYLHLELLCLDFLERISRTKIAEREHTFYKYEYDVVRLSLKKKKKC